MSFANTFLRQIRREIPEIRQSGSFYSQEYILPNCLNCGKEEKMYFHPEEGFYCFVCTTGGSIKTFCNLLRSKGYRIGIDESLISYQEKGLRKKEIKKLTDKPFIVDVPEEAFSITKSYYPKKFVNRRSIDINLLLKLDTQYCMTGRYHNRLIFPLSTGFNKSFLAYHTNPTPETRKVLYPDSNPMGKFLFPFDYVVNLAPKRLTLVEGALDAIRVIRHSHTLKNGILPLSLLGKNVTDYRLKMLNLLIHSGLKEIILCLDADTRKTKALNKAMDKLVNYFGRDMISVVDMLACGSNTIKAILKNAFIKRNKKYEPEEIDPDLVFDPNHWELILDKRRPLRKVLYARRSKAPTY